MDAPVIVLAGVRAELQAPSPLAALALLRSPAAEAAMESAEGWALASLALLECWPLTAAWPVPLRPRRWRVGENAAERGREVFDGLMSAGTVPLSALLGPVDEDGILQVAGSWARSCITSRLEVAGAKDFCLVRAAPASGSDSASPDATTSPLPGGTA